MAGQLSTPLGPGLEWFELLEGVDQVMRSCNVVGSDVVELNPERRSKETFEENELIALVMVLIDGLARKRDE